MGSEEIRERALEAVQILHAFPSNAGEIEGRITEKGARMIDACLDDIRAALALPGVGDDPAVLAQHYRKALESIARGDFNVGSRRQHRSAWAYAGWALRNIGRPK